MRILAIETSCDETAVAVLECSGGLEKPVFKVLGNALNSQIEMHKGFGGVVPDIAKREHIKWLPILLEKMPKEPVDLVAVTSGPGLEPALWAGITFAEELSKKWNVPVMPINHMEGHVLSVLYNAGTIEFPALALLVSGGHTELVEVKNYGEYKVLGKTLDDAAGEAFDKVARMLGLPYPGGALIGEFASSHRKKFPAPELTFTVPMLHSDNLDLSYSGLKTAVLYKIKALGALDEAHKEALARAFEDAAIAHLIDKTKTALEAGEVRTLVVGGGVSANTYLRQELEKLLIQFPETSLRFPDRGLSTDNAIMIGIAAYIEHLLGTKTATGIRAEGKLSF